MKASVEVVRMGMLQKLDPSQAMRENCMESAGTNATVCSGMLASPGGIRADIELDTHVEGTS